MVSLLRILVVLFALALIAGFIVLGTVDLQPETQRIEKTIPNERFER